MIDMVVRQMFIAAAAVFSLFFFTESATAQQPQITYAGADPFNQQFRVATSDGVSVVADGVTEILYVSTPQGVVNEVSFQQAVESLNLSTAERQLMLENFRKSLRDTGHMATIAPPRIASDQTIWINEPQMCGEHLCIIFDSITPTLQTANSQSECNHYLCPRINFPCDFGPCSPRNWTDQLFTYSGFNAGWGDDKGGGTVTQQQLIAYDKARWTNEREEQCSSMKWKGAATVASGIGTVAACATSVTVVGAVACAGGAVAFAVSFHDFERASKQCFSSYPGVGNW